MNRKARRSAERSGSTPASGLGSGNPGQPAPRAEHDGPAARALLLLRDGRWQEAQTVLQQRLARAPRDHAALHLLGVICRERGEPARAIELLRKAVGLQPELLAYRGNLGHAYLLAEQFAAAAECYKHFLSRDPGSGLARFGLGMARLGARQYEAASVELRAVAQADPRHVDARANLGSALSELGRHDEAVGWLEQSLRLRPGSAVLHLKLGTALRRRGDFAEACQHLARAAALDPTLPDAPFQTGCILHALDRLDDAAQALEHASVLRPDWVPALYELGQVYNRLQWLERAAECFSRALTLDPRSPLLLQGLARTRHLQGRCGEARGLLARALACGGDAAECHTMLGLVLQSEGDFEAAAAAYRQAVALQPAQSQAQLCLAMLASGDDAAARLSGLERLVAAAADNQEQAATLQYALARTHNQLGDHDAAFRHYKAANDIRCVQHPFDELAQLAFEARLVAAFDQAWCAEPKGGGSASERPIFVVGMMRSGTTLVEQILASHSGVHGHGELDHMRQLAAATAGLVGGGRGYPECVAGLRPDLAAELAGRYLRRLEHDAGDTARSIDKLPQNFERLGLIARLFPRARIIHCMRDPVETCLSCYLQDFGADNRFTNDLATLGRYYRYYRRLMAHWHSVLPGPILDVPLESLVADQEGWSRRIVAFAGLPWEPGCLAFHENRRPVYTYSLRQVRQPIFRTATPNWHRYARRLGPLFDGLGLPAPAE